MTSQRYRSIWISDFHLGTKECKAEFLLDFLRHNESDHLYLVGDVFDGWAMAKTLHWNQLHNDVIQKILRKARKGTRVTYLPGNHDEFARDYLGLDFGRIEVKQEVIHETADGRKLLVFHGDEFDGVIHHARWLSILGAHAYRYLMQINRALNWMRRVLGLPYWSLSAYLKHQTKRAVQFIANFETTMVNVAATKNADGVVCGHIHYPEIRMIGNLQYANCGDWVESCSALVEHFDGSLELVRWVTMDHQPRLARLDHSQGDGHSQSIPELAADPSG